MTSKLWNTKHCAEDVEPALKQTLSDLGLTYLDLYLMHWPIAFQRGEDVFPKNEDGTLKVPAGGLFLVRVFVHAHLCVQQPHWRREIS